MRIPVIIAEAGVNHNGDMAMARRLIDVAADAGADYVKFQTFDAGALVSRSAPLADYQRRNLGGGDSQYEMLRRLQLSETQHLELVDYCSARGIRFLSTAFDPASVELLASLGLDLWKIPSGEITNYPYLRQIARYGGRVVMSTGMCEPEDIEAALAVLTENGVEKRDITLLHCNTEYPTPMGDVNLRAMPEMGHAFGVDYGYSDHTPGIDVSLAAVALGASVIEKHITLDRSLPGPDQKASIEPDELRCLVEGARNIAVALGSDQKHVTDSERSNMAVARKSIVAATYINKGEIITEDKITTRRPGTGLSPMAWPRVVGTAAIRDFLPDQQIEI